MSQGRAAVGDRYPADVKLLRWLLSPCPHSSITLLLPTPPAHGSSSLCQGSPLTGAGQPPPLAPRHSSSGREGTDPPQALGRCFPDAERYPRNQPATKAPFSYHPPHGAAHRQEPIAIILDLCKG